MRAPIIAKQRATVQFNRARSSPRPLERTYQPNNGTNTGDCEMEQLSGSCINHVIAEREMTIEPFLKMNIGGCSFRIRSETVYRRLPESRLAKFVLLSSKEERGKSCQGHLADSDEYYFERSAKLFDPIYKFYATGQLHRPLDVCIYEFQAELQFWQIPWDQLSPCCSRMLRQDGSKRKSEQMDERDAFSAVKYGAVRRQVWGFFEGDGSLWSSVFSFCSISFVLISVIGLILGSIRHFQVSTLSVQHSNVSIPDYYYDNGSSNDEDARIVFEPHPAFGYAETVCIIWFTVEYLLRFAVAPLKCKFVRGPMNIVDLIAIVPFYLELTLSLCGVDVVNMSDIKGALLVVRVLRVLRVVRILKLGRYSSGMRTFALTLRSSARQLGMMFMVLSTGIVFFSTLVYFIEKDEPKTPFQSIPAGFWWCIVTMTTVGYGDVVPSTIAGKIVASGAIVSGVLVLALPITIIVDNFMKVSGQTGAGLVNLGKPDPTEEDAVSSGYDAENA